MLFRSTTKAAEGHDMPMTYPELVSQVGAELAGQLKELSLRVFTQAAERCRERGLILCDTKFEFGHLPGGELVLIDEALTPEDRKSVG